jgi:hypothetical protein
MVTQFNVTRGRAQPRRPDGCRVLGAWCLVLGHRSEHAAPEAGDVVYAGVSEQQVAKDVHRCSGDSRIGEDE